VLGISPQDIDSHERWAEKLGIPYALLADTDKRVIAEYGAKGFGLIPVKRSVFVIDKDGVVRFANRKALGATFVSFDKMKSVLEGA
jgi:thioredoxin-dependent peroxiredoxin